MNKKKKDKEWKTEKARLESLALDERRLGYGRSDYVSLEKIPTCRQDDEEGKNLLSDKISLYKGDITILEVDAIVNAANSSLLGGGGVDGCIHKAAGPCLYDECHTLNGCDTGKAKITCGYDLPAKYVIHTVGPVARGHVGQTERDDLTSCYQNSLRLLKENDLHTVAFPCISTGIYGFPNDPAAEIALRTVRSWIEENYAQVTRVIFCVFLETDHNIYKEKIPHIFQDNDVSQEATEEGRDKDEGQPKEGNPGNEAPAKDSKSKTATGDNPADEEDTAADVEMASQKVNTDDLDMESQKQDQTVQDPDDKELKGSTAAVDVETPAADRGSEDVAGDNAEADRKRTQTSAEPEGDVKKDGVEAEEAEASQEVMEGVEEEPAGMESGPSISGAEKAQGEGSQGSDLTQTDSTQSKEPVEKNE